MKQAEYYKKQIIKKYRRKPSELVLLSVPMLKILYGEKEADIIKELLDEYCDLAYKEFFTGVPRGGPPT